MAPFSIDIFHIIYASARAIIIFVAVDAAIWYAGVSVCVRAKASALDVFQ